MIHKYCQNGRYIVLDTYSGSVHELDKLSYDLLDYTDENMSEECPERAISDLKSEGYSEEEIRECYAELYGLYKDEEEYCSSIEIV